MNDILIQVQNLCKSYGKGSLHSEVLKDISFDVREGEFVSVMGPSGCGKSTLLYLIGGLEKPDSGTVSVCGNNIENMSDEEQSIMRRRDIGFVFQFYNLVPNLTVKENILLPVIMDKRSTAKYQKHLDALLGIIDLQNKKNSFPSELSGGQQQRVAIARALIMKPKVLLADEATGNLDRKSGMEIIKLFNRVNQKLGTAILQVTHSEEIASYGKRIITLSDGIIEQDITK